MCVACGLRVAGPAGYFAVGGRQRPEIQGPNTAAHSTTHKSDFGSSELSAYSNPGGRLKYMPVGEQGGGGGT